MNGQRIIKDANCFSINPIIDIKNFINDLKVKKFYYRCNWRYWKSSSKKINDLSAKFSQPELMKKSLTVLKNYPNIIIAIENDEHNQIEKFIIQ